MDNNKLIIIGSGGHCRIVSDIAERLKFKIKGIIDLKYKNATNETINGNKIIGGIDLLDQSKFRNYYYFLAIGDIKLRSKLYNNYRKNIKFVNLIDKKSIVSNNANIGKAILISPGAIINSCATIEDNTIINTNSILEHETFIGKNSNISPGVIIGGRTKIGKDCFIGLGTKIIDNIKIGKNVFIGAGSLIIKDIEDNSKVFGSPAKKYK